MLKILQARLQQYVNRALPDVQAGFRKGRGTRDQIANIRWIIKKPKMIMPVKKQSSFLFHLKVFTAVKADTVASQSLETLHPPPDGPRWLLHLQALRLHSS